MLQGFTFPKPMNIPVTPHNIFMPQGFILPMPRKVKNIPAVPPISDFPSDILKWMKKNNTNPKMVLKLMQICQYFQFGEFPYCVVKNLWGHSRINLSHWSYWPLGTNTVLNVKTFSKPLWIIDCFRLTKFDKLPEIAFVDLNSLVLAEVKMDFDEFKLLTASGNLTQLYLSDSVIQEEEYGEIVPFEKLFEFLPKINGTTCSNSIFSYSESAIFGNNEARGEPYKIEECFTFFQNNQHIHFNFSIFGQKDEEFVERLQLATDNLLKAWSSKNKPPVIYFADQTSESKNHLKTLQELFKKQKKDSD